ncbi:MAG TPA: hypothetical protein VNL72_02445 [Gammaproteobacteria bacterium]|nr:hypothetical protein [Gammaproteobacteria bacterium]
MSRQRNDLRRLLAQEAARIIALEGVRDFLAAKRKAAARLGVRNQSHTVPTNVEIEAALVEYQRLFHADTQGARLRTLREAAHRAMRLFERFEPRLVGSVLNGTATVHASVELHLFVDGAEQVALHLMQREIPFETVERRLKRVAGDYLTCPAYRFLAGDVTIEAVVFPYDAIREAPASAVDGRPMRRATIRDLEALLSEESGW